MEDGVSGMPQASNLPIVSRGTKKTGDFDPTVGQSLETDTVGSIFILWMLYTGLPTAHLKISRCRTPSRLRAETR